MKRPRTTAWWGKQLVRHTELWQRIVDDPEARPLIAQIAAHIAGAYSLELEHGMDPRAERLLDDAWIGTEGLTLRVRAIAPDLDHFYGDQLIHAVLRYVAGHELDASGVDVRSLIKEIPPLQVRGLPDTAITFTDEAAVVPRDTPNSDLLKLGTFLDSYKPAGKPGRRPGSIANTDQARQAFTLHGQGAHWHDIAEALTGTRPDQDRPETYEAMNRMVNRRIKRGRELAEHERPTN